MDPVGRLPNRIVVRAALSLLIPALAAACPAQQATHPPPPAPVPAAAAPDLPPIPGIPTDNTMQVVSETYLGMLNCPDCSGIRAEITLYWEGHDGHTPIAYHLTESYPGVPDRAPVEAAGFFSEQQIPDLAQLTGGPAGGSLIRLRTGKPPVEAFLRVPGNNGELLLLNAKLHVLPDGIQHSLGRVSGEQQQGLTVLTDRDDGRTVTLKGGEVFVVVLPVHEDAYRWNCDRPAAMALLEPDDQPPPSQLLDVKQPPWPGAAAPKTLLSVERSRGNAAYHAAHTTNRGPSYQVWQMVAPPSENTNTPVERVLTFQLRNPRDEAGVLPSKIVTLRIDVP